MRVVFFGSPEFAVPTLQKVAAAHEVVLVVCQPDRPAGRGRAVTAPAVKTAALSLGLAVEQPLRLKDPELAGRLAALRPDLFVVIAYGRILPPTLLAVPRLGPYNVHASLLPRYRGAAPIQWSIIRGESVSGVAIMQMEEGLDTGPVVALREEPITDVDTAGSLAQRLSLIGADLMVETMPRIEAGTIHVTPQEHARATLAPILTKEDGLLDFRQPARLVSAHARGVDPWPGAMATIDGDVVKLFTPVVVDGKAANAQPGVILGLGPKGLEVSCADGVVAFAELQFPGRKRLPASAVLAGRAIPPGTVAVGKV
ncbi:MAG TPA: methionyl-tRNA formyltransferase [Polyangia bacterium]